MKISKYNPKWFLNVLVENIFILNPPQLLPNLTRPPKKKYSPKPKGNGVLTVTAWSHHHPIPGHSHASPDEILQGLF